MLPILLTLLIALPSTLAFVDCRIACRTCREDREESSVLEVHCAMCEECKQRRRERMQKDRVRDDYPQAPYYSRPREDFYQERNRPPPQGFRKPLRQLREEEEAQNTVREYPEGCPTAAYCTDSSAEETPAVRTTAIPPTTCPSIPKCVKKKKKKHTSATPVIQYITVPMQQPMPYAQPSCCCMPMGPMQFCGNNQCQCANKNNIAATVSSTTQSPAAQVTKDFVNVYVGIPKEILRIG